MRLLRALVAVRLDARHVGRRARRHDRLLLTYLVLYAFPPEHASRLPHRVAAMDFLLLLALVAGSRLLARTLLERPQSGLVAHGKEVLIVGAGNAGQLLVREIQRNRALAYTPIGFVDDDPKKKKVKILGVRVLGTTDELSGSCTRTARTRC